MKDPANSSHSVPGDLPRESQLVSPCERQGALMPRLVHEMTNQLLIISGNAQIAERSDNDPLAAAQAIKAILQASDTAGRLLDGYAAYLRQLPRPSASGSVSEVASLIAQNAQGDIGWRIDIKGALAGCASLDPRWIAFAVWQIVQVAGASEGEITLCCGIPRSAMPLAIPIQSHAVSSKMLQILLNWRSPSPLLPEDELRKPKNLSLAVIHGLLSSVGGDCHYFFGHPDQNRFALMVPLAGSSTGG